jgi:hypothetical protein
LPLPDTPVTQVKVAQREIHVDVAQVVFRRPRRITVRTLAAALPARPRDGDALFPGEVLAVMERGHGHDILQRCPWATTSPPWTPAPGPMSTM